ncbi:MAG: hypothetical protein HY681_07770 [Chloroflexi bacterium]|nr:hypothetical protein [Chloroflexota bacterium]
MIRTNVVTRTVGSLATLALVLLGLAAALPAGASAARDTQTPVITLVTPQDNLQEKVFAELDDGLLVQAKVTDDAGVASVEWEVQGERGPLSFNQATGLYEGRIPESEFLEIVAEITSCDFILTIRALDLSFNYAESSWQLEIQEPSCSSLKRR